MALPEVEASLRYAAPCVVIRARPGGVGGDLIAKLAADGVPYAQTPDTIEDPAVFCGIHVNPAESAIAVVRGPRGAALGTLSRALTRACSVQVEVDGAHALSSEVLRSSAILDLSEDAALFLRHGDAADMETRSAALRSGGAVTVIGLDAASDPAALGLNGAPLVDALPLRDRKSDIDGILAAVFRSSATPPTLTDEAIELLRSWPWEGDVQELVLFARRLLTYHRGEILARDDVGRMLIPSTSYSSEVAKPLAEVEREHILRVLDNQGWNRTRSAKTLGIDVKTLYNKLKRYRATARHHPAENVSLEVAAT